MERKRETERQRWRERERGTLLREARSQEASMAQVE